MALASETEIRAAYESDATAASYVADRFVSELHRLLHDAQVAAVQRAIGRVRPQRTLEIAPGPGRATRDVRPTGTLVCVEFNQGMIAHGRSSCANGAAWVRGDGFRLPVAGGFDLVYSFRFVRHFHREDRERLYGEVRRVLRPGGWLVIDAVNERVSRPLRDAHPDEYPLYDKLYRPDELRDELSGAGLIPVEFEPVQKFYRAQWCSQVLLGPRASSVNRLIVRGLEWLPKRDGLEWIITCRRA